MGTLSLVDLDQPRSGYRKFLSSWVWQDEGLSYVVDPGPSSTVPWLVKSLEELGVTRLDLVLLTHVHLDHGGGTADLLAHHPEARVYCHSNGVKHVIDPSRLWKGSVAVLGDVAEMYGEPGPVPASSMVDEAALEGLGLTVIPTPGHAPHHVSFLHDDILYAGEAIGTRIPLPSGLPYLRPATPPRFFLDEAVGSLDRLLGLEPEPQRTALAHYGEVGPAFPWCVRARSQLLQWTELAQQLGAESRDDLEARFFERLMEDCPLYGQGRFDELESDLKARERKFLRNTLEGLQSHLDNR